MIVGVASQLSDEVADPVFPGSVLAEHCMVIFAGHEIVGDVLSSRTMDWLQVLLFPHASVTRQVLVIVYSCEHIPPVIASV